LIFFIVQPSITVTDFILRVLVAKLDPQA